MIPALWTILTTNKLARALGIAVMAVLGVLTFGAVKKREGAKDQKAKQDVANAKATIQALEARDEVEDRIARDGDARGKLHDKWRE